MGEFSFQESYELLDGRMYILKWNLKDIILGPVIGFVNGKWRGRFAWEYQSPDFDDRDTLAEWMVDRYLSNI